MSTLSKAKKPSLKDKLLAKEVKDVKVEKLETKKKK